jgi:protein-tyrosine phosphatase
MVMVGQERNGFSGGFSVGVNASMISLVDMHCHLLAGLDDGPRTEADALAMCRIAYQEGVRMAAATAHQNERWAAVTPATIRVAARRLTDLLHESGIPLTVFPCAEVMIHPGIDTAWSAGELLSDGDHGRYLLMEMPPGLVLDLRSLVGELRLAGIRPILAHPERHEAFLHEAGWIEQLVQAGCLVQVSAGSVTAPRSREDERALKSWFRRGVVHLLGSDGHSPTRRAPRMAAAYQKIRAWAGLTVADRVCSTNGMAILQGLMPRFPAPTPARRRWLSPLW